MLWSMYMSRRKTKKVSEFDELVDIYQRMIKVMELINDEDISAAEAEHARMRRRYGKCIERNDPVVEWVGDWYYSMCTFFRKAKELNS
jgi:hypothetical protein